MQKTQSGPKPTNGAAQAPAGPTPQPAVQRPAPPPPRNAIAREDVGGTELQILGETASTAAAAQAEAAVKARYAMAAYRRRSIDQVRVDLLTECKRTRFADIAIYRKPIGNGFVEGPSVRFAEAVVRAMTNILIEQSITFDDAERRQVRLAVTDLETNVTRHKDIVIEKTVERSNASGREVVSQRTNKAGRATFRVLATEDEMFVKEAALSSKAVRDLAIFFLPGDIRDEAIDLCKQTIKDEATHDPTAARKRVADEFFALGVMPQQIFEYLGHDLGSLTPDEYSELKAAYRTIRDGEAKWSEILAAKLGRAQAPQAPASQQQPARAATLPEAAQAQAEDDSTVFDGTPEAPAATEAPSGDNWIPDELHEVLDAIKAAKTLSELQKLAGKVRALPAELMQDADKAYRDRKATIQKPTGGSS